jgi:hypothetical protein
VETDRGFRSRSVWKPQWLGNFERTPGYGPAAGSETRGPFGLVCEAAFGYMWAMHSRVMKLGWIVLLVWGLITLAANAQQQLQLVLITNSWKYNQSGADLSGMFQQTNYNDGAWPSGRGLLGLETSSPYPYPYPILTPLTVSNGRITFYFRTRFNFPSNTVGVTLRATNYVDDGAVFYLNGQEAQRLRMPLGEINAGTLAMNANPEGQANVLGLDASGLVQGDNMLAVEVHQTTANSTDIVFGMSLIAILPEPGPVRITNQPPDRTVEEGESTTFTAQIAGSAPYFFQWFRNGSAMADATNQVFTIGTVSTNDAGLYSFSVSNLFSSATSGNATLTVTPAAATLIMITNTWRYNISGLNLGSGWRLRSFNDSAWPLGQGAFYNETATLPAPKNTFLPLTNSSGGRIITYYFRTSFNWVGSTAGAVLRARTLIDDGAVFYINGAEAARIGMPAPPAVIAYNTLASRTIENADTYSVIALDPSSLVEGQNVLAVEVHQSATNSSDVVFAAAVGTNYALSLPDLILWAPASDPRARYLTFASGDCEVLEGCGIPGTRRVLQFGTETRNIGTEDLFLGNPIGNPLFEYDSCHDHYHFNDFAEYRLLDLSGAQVALGNKVGFCLLDYHAWDPNANPNSVYDCGNQGIQKGWADVYSASLPCQWIDITGLPAGDYVIELEIDPENRIAELNETNNVSRLMVTISDPCTGPPPNDNFAGAQLIPQGVATVIAQTECATKEPGEPNHYGNNGQHSVWYRWTAPSGGTLVLSTEGSNFDTILAVYRGTALNNLIRVATNDDSGVGVTSRIVMQTTTGDSLYIAVDGYGSDFGKAVLNVNPAANDNFSLCFPISGGSGTFQGINSPATREAGEPQHAGVAGTNSVWFCWTAPSAGWFSFDTFGSSGDTLLAVYTGSTVSSLTRIAANDDADAAGGSQVAFRATTGMACRIAVDAVPGGAGVFKLNWRPITVPQFISIQRNSDATAHLTLTGEGGAKYVIETSTNLSLWSDWLNVTNASGTTQIVDPAATPAQKFYRARLVP